MKEKHFHISYLGSIADKSAICMEVFMTEQLKEKLAVLPEEPGVYKMLNSKRDVIYIGKSKCLKKRVKSYSTLFP